MRLRGPFVGASGWYTLGDEYPVLFRRSAGPLFAWVRDDRTGSFRLDIALACAQWDPTKEIDAAIDGIGALGNEGLTGPALLVITPGIGARYEF